MIRGFQFKLSINVINAVSQSKIGKLTKSKHFLTIWKGDRKCSISSKIGIYVVGYS